MKESGHKEPINRNKFDYEIITTALIVAKFFYGHINNAINFVKSSGLMPNMLGKSRFNRRIHVIFELITNLFFNIAKVIKKINISFEYIIESFPVSVCESIRISRFRIVKVKQFRDYKASLRKYFYGYSVQVIATVDGRLVEFAILPGSTHDIDGMKNMYPNIPESAILYGDSAYTDYSFEEGCKEAEKKR